jgi:quinol monooxygenase YgiN
MDKVIVCLQKIVISLTLIIMLVSCSAASAQQKQIMVRISEIEIDSNYLNEYKAILKEESEASVRLEPGVISIFPMYQKENLTEVRILEIYASREAYESHLKTPHFQHYKTTTLKMVKSLKLVDMETIDAKTMTEIFKKMEKR